MKITQILTAFMALFCQLSVAAPQAPNGEYVVVVHGIFRSKAHMKPLADYLKGEGYEVLNIEYPSTKYPIAELVEMVAREMDGHITDKSRKVNFVGYSMGGLIVRGIIAQHRPENLGRVVLIATPNHGSEVADFWKNNILYKKIYGPAGQQLTTDYDFGHLFGPVNYELGIIAGNSSIDPFSSFLIPGPDDGKVSVESTKLEGMKDWIVVPANHTFFPKNKKAQEETGYFLREGIYQEGLLPSA